MTISQYFHKVKSLCREISELDPEAPIGDTRMKHIIIHGLKPEFRSFIAAIQGWQVQPSLVEFKNLLAGQKALAKQMGRVSLKKKQESLYANRGRWNSKQYTTSISQKNNDKERSHQGVESVRAGGASQNQDEGKNF
ncbi:hypothetical protein P3S67_030271 [Capsicum chacoense]